MSETNLGERIFACRKKCGLSQEEVANKLNVSRQSVSLWETGASNPSTEKLLGLAALFGVSLDELLGKTPPADEKDGQPIPDQAVEAENQAESPFAVCTTDYNAQLFKRLYNRLMKKRFILLIVCTAFSATAALFTAIIPHEDGWTATIIYSIFAVIFILLIVLTVIRKRKAVSNATRLSPDGVAHTEFYDEYLETTFSSARGESKRKIFYKDIKQTVTDGDFIYIFVFGTVTPVDLSAVGDKKDFVLFKTNIINTPGQNRTPLKIRVTSTILMILSFASLFLSLIVMLVIITISTSATGYPVDIVMLKSLQTFLFFVPLPIASLIFGIICTKKGYRRLRNIIAGAIMTAVLLLYGGFGALLYSINVMHDTSYLEKISADVGINFPDAKSIVYTRGTTNSRRDIVVIFDDNEHIAQLLDSSGWSSDRADIRTSDTYTGILLPTNHGYAVTANDDYFYSYTVCSARDVQLRYYYMAYRESDKRLYISMLIYFAENDLAP